MAKRGSTRPWRIRFTWAEHDGRPAISGTETRSTLSEAEDFARQLEATSDRRGAPLSYTIQHRDRPEPERVVEHQPQDIEED